MPWVCFTHSAMIGSRDRPCSEYRFPPNELPYCFSRATARMDAREASFAASVAVTPWARARSHSLWLVASATTRRSTGWLIPPGWGAQEGGAGRAEGGLLRRVVCWRPPPIPVRAHTAQCTNCRRPDYPSRVGLWASLVKDNRLLSSRAPLVHPDLNRVREKLL